MTPALATNVSVDYRTRPGVLRDVVLQVAPGEILGLVGQSGSGKTTLVMTALGLLSQREATVRGSIVINGIDIRRVPERDLRHIRGRVVSLIPQNPVAALNPSLCLGSNLKEAWLAHAKDWRGEGLKRARFLLRGCSLPEDDEFLRRYPDEISAGQAQRVLISMALLHDPVLLIADEPTSALDLVTQREVLDLLARLNAERQMSILFVSHDLQAVGSLCHSMAILHDGTIVECGPTSSLLSVPQHPFTTLLLSSVPRPPTPGKVEEDRKRFQTIRLAATQLNKECAVQLEDRCKRHVEL